METIDTNRKGQTRYSRTKRDDPLSHVPARLSFLSARVSSIIPSSHQLIHREGVLSERQGLI